MRFSTAGTLKFYRDADLAAIQASVADYEAGERGEPAREELASFRAERKVI